VQAAVTSPRRSGGAIQLTGMRQTPIAINAVAAIARL
jgi:hypothetical protein